MGASTVDGTLVRTLFHVACYAAKNIETRPMPEWWESRTFLWGEAGKSGTPKACCISSGCRFPTGMKPIRGAPLQRSPSWSHGNRPGNIGVCRLHSTHEERRITGGSKSRCHRGWFCA